MLGLGTRTLRSLRCFKSRGENREKTEEEKYFLNVNWLNKNEWSQKHYSTFSLTLLMQHSSMAHLRTVLREKWLWKIFGNTCEIVISVSISIDPTGSEYKEVWALHELSISFFYQTKCCIFWVKFSLERCSCSLKPEEKPQHNIWTVRLSRLMLIKWSRAKLQ